MARRIGLGRGLDALLDNNDVNSVEIYTPPAKEAAPPTETKNKSQDIFQLPAGKLVPNPGQPRKNFKQNCRNLRLQ